MKQYLYMFVVASLILSGCGKDDGGVPEISLEEQNIQDDRAIQIFLQTHYFDDLGRVQEFDDEDSSDDNETPLIDNAEELNDGVYYVKNNAVPANGPSVIFDNISQQDILLHYDMNIFTSGYDSENETYTVDNYTEKVLSSTATTGLPQWNPPFYKVDLAEDAPNDASYYEMPGFRSAITFFNSTEKNSSEPYIFQGVIVMPSRANYGREANYLGFRNVSAVINFELYKVQDTE